MRQLNLLGTYHVGVTLQVQCPGTPMLLVDKVHIIGSRSLDAISLAHTNSCSNL